VFQKEFERLGAEDGCGFPASLRPGGIGVKGMQELRGYIDTIRKLPLGEEIRDGILGATAMDLLKL
jgi:hypothetical protein